MVLVGLHITQFGRFQQIDYYKGVVASASRYAAFSALPMWLSSFLLARLYLRTSQRVKEIDAASKSSLYSLMANIFDPDGLRMIRGIGGQNHTLSAATSLLQISQKPYCKGFEGKMELDSSNFDAQILF